MLRLRSKKEKPGCRNNYWGGLGGKWYLRGLRDLCASLCFSLGLSLGLVKGRKGAGGAGDGIAGGGFLAHVPSLARRPTAIHEIHFISED